MHDMSHGCICMYTRHRRRSRSGIFIYLGSVLGDPTRILGIPWRSIFFYIFLINTFFGWFGFGIIYWRFFWLFIIEKSETSNQLNQKLFRS